MFTDSNKQSEIKTESTRKMSNFNSQSGLEIKKIFRSPFGDKLEKCSRQVQFLVASLYNVNEAAHSISLASDI